MKTRYFYIKDVDCVAIVEIAKARKEVFGWLEQYIENLQYDFFDPSDDSFAILYDDGTEDYIDSDYDGHRIRKQHIVSMVYNNPCTSIVFGTFAINDCGVVTVSDEEMIDDINIKEVDREDYTEREILGYSKKIVDDFENEFKLAMIVPGFAYYANYEESDDNGNTIIMNEKHEILSNNISDILMNKQTVINKM